MVQLDVERPEGTGTGEAKSTSQVARHIARTAAQLFAQRGYDATPVRAIVEAAGVTKPTLYYHFGSKAGLAHALLIRPLDDLASELERLVSEPIEPAQRLAAMIEANFAFCRDDPDRARFVYALLFGPLGSGLAEELQRFSERICELWQRAGRSVAEAGLISQDRIDDLVANLRGLLVIRTIDFLYRGIELGPDLARRLVADLLLGLANGAERPNRSPS